MSRSALIAPDRETFIKSQIVAVQKVLNKAEAPLKQKHVRVLIVGTHKEKSATLFWSTVSRIPLEKNPIITWKFCNLLHKLIRDGHRKVPDDSARFISRLVQLGNFWQHLRASGYGHADAMYCRMLTKRLQMHQKYPQIPGSLELTQPQIDAISSDMDCSFELGIDLLDQLDELLAFKAAVITLVDGYRWTSMVPQCQCLLAPLILVVLDTSLLYDILVKLCFKLHAALPEDVLTGHRQRFLASYKKLKDFYESATSLQYFKYLVSIPTLPATAPNFLESSDLDTYRTPHAYVKEDHASSEGTDTPPDAQSLQEENLIIDLTTEDLSHQQSSSGYNSSNSSEQQQMMEKMNELRIALESEMKAKDSIVNEARSRIEQYENRLVEMKQESDHYKFNSESLAVQLQQLKDSTTAAEEQALIQMQEQDKATEFEKKYNKLKSAYDTFRGEHIAALTELRDLRKFKADSEKQEDVDIDPDAVGAQLQDEMQKMNNAIKHAVERIKQIQEQARSKNSGVRLEVNEKILEHCNDLMSAVYVLVERARDLQQEIVDAGKGSGSPSEFYKKNHQWTKGLLSAAQAVGVSAVELMNSADKVVLNAGKLEYLTVAAQEISASVAQLYVSSRVKADRDSEKLIQLGQASKKVNEATAAVLAAVRDGKQTLEEKELFDFSHYSLHDAKKAEMECQVKVLELESLLTKERSKLASLRKQHYHMASLVSNETEESTS